MAIQIQEVIAASQIPMSFSPSSVLPADPLLCRPPQKVQIPYSSSVPPPSRSRTSGSVLCSRPGEVLTPRKNEPPPPPPPM